MFVCVCVLSHSVVSDSLQPRGLEPAKLLCPWDYPGKNAGVSFPPPGDLPNPGIEPRSLMPLALTGRFFTTEPPVEPKKKGI